MINDTLKLRGRVTIEIRDAKTGRWKSRQTVKNLVVTLAKTAVANSLRGNVANNKGQITFCAVGTGTNAPALGNTTLQTEIYRKQISVRGSELNIASFKTFFNQTEANGVLKEAGLFGESATSTANSGTLFARTVFNKTKTSSDTMTLTWTITVG